MSNFTFLAWQPDPSLRPELSYLFNDLENLSAPFISGSSPKGLAPKPTTDNDVTPIESPGRTSSTYETFDLPSTPDYDLDQITTVMPMMKLEDGITAHKNGERKQAFECFQK